MDATSSVTSTDTTSQTGFGLTTGAEQAIGRDEFLKLLVAQLKNQDPLKPQDNTQFVAELAQFSSLEQTMGINDRLDTLTLQSRGQSNAEVITLVGKVATVRGSMVTSDGNGLAVPLSFTLADATEKTTVTITDDTGRAVRTLELGPKGAGVVQVSWDGRDLAGNVQPAGSYQVVVQASSDTGAAVSVTQQSSGLVKSISFDKGYPVLQLDSGLSAPVSDLLRVDSPPVDP